MAFSKDGRVGSHATKTIFVDEALQFAAGEQVTADVVQPYRLTELQQIFEWIGSFGGFKNSYWLHKTSFHDLSVDQSSVFSLQKNLTPFSDDRRLTGCLLFSNCFSGRRDYVLGGEPELLLQILDRRGRSKACIPITVPFGPTYCDQPKVEACSTATRAVTHGGRTLAL